MRLPRLLATLTMVIALGSCGGSAITTMKVPIIGSKASGKTAVGKAISIPGMTLSDQFELFAATAGPRDRQLVEVDPGQAGTPIDAFHAVLELPAP